MARTRFGDEGEDWYDPRWTPTAAEKDARSLFFDRLEVVAPQVGTDLHEGCGAPYREAGAPDLERLRREKGRRLAPLRRALLTWRRRWHLRERAPRRDPWILDAALWTLRLARAGLEVPPGLLLQPLGSVAAGVPTVVPRPSEWNWQRGETETAYRQRVEEYIKATRDEAGFEEVRGANKAERDFDLLIRRRILGLSWRELFDALPDALDRRTANSAIARAANHIGLK